MSAPTSRLARARAAIDPRTRGGQWGVVAALAAIDLVWAPLAGFRIVPAGWAVPLGTVALLSALGAYYTYLRELQDDRIPETLNGTAVLIAYTAVAAAFSYLMTSLGLPLIDPALAAADRAIGFDWVGYHRALNANRVVAATLALLYHSLLVQVAIVTIVLGFLGRGARVRELMGLLIVTSLPMVVVSGLLPAQSAWLHHGEGLEFAYHRAAFFGLREGTLRTLAPSEAVGIVTFPSFHTAVALLVPWACRDLRWLSWPLAAINLAVLVSIPSFGGHYLVDMIAGAAVTLAAAWWFARGAGPVRGAGDTLTGGRGGL